MKMMEIMNKHLIKMDMTIRNKREFIEELSSLLDKEGMLVDKSLFIKDVLKREAEGITGIGDYIAIPHGVSKGVKNNCIVIGQSNVDVAWESVDDLPVRIVIMFAVKQGGCDESKNHLSMMAMVAKALAHDEFKKRLLNATNPQTIIDIFHNNEEG